MNHGHIIGIELSVSNADSLYIPQTFFFWTPRLRLVRSVSDIVGHSASSVFSFMRDCTYITVARAFRLN